MKKQPHPAHSSLAPRSPGNRAGNRARSGFTLLEVMMVVVILGILIGIGITGINPKKNTDKAKAAVTEATISTISQQVVLYEMENNKYPASLETLKSEGVMNIIKPDGWGKPLDYNPSTGEVWANGPDGKISSKDL